MPDDNRVTPEVNVFVDFGDDTPSAAAEPVPPPYDDDDFPPEPPEDFYPFEDDDAPQARGVFRPDLPLTDTDPRDLFDECITDDTGQAREPSLSEFVSQPLSAPALTVPNTHQQVGGAISALLDGRLRQDQYGDWHAWNGTAWETQSPAQVTSLIKGLTGRPDRESSVTRAIVPYRNQKLTAELAENLIASGIATDDGLNGLRWKHNGSPVITVPMDAHDWSESSDTAARVRTDISGRASVFMRDDFDTTAGLINASGTLIDLGPEIVEAIRCRPLTRHDLVSRSLGVGFDPDATAASWEQFVKEVMSETDAATGAVVYRPELEQFLQVLVGVTLLGEVQEEIIPILHGLLGSNGKSVFVNVLLKVFGEYAATLPKAVLEEQRGQAHTTDLTLLQGARMAYAKETKRVRWDTEMLKDLASREDLVARRMRQDNRSWTPTHTLWVTTNNLPLVPAGEQAFWRRVLVIPFKQRWYSDGDNAAARSVSIGPIDPDLTKKLLSEASGILNWALDGLRMYYAMGKLVVPQAVRQATEAARTSASLWAEFVATAIDPTQMDTDTIEVRKLWKLWNGYCSMYSQHEKVAPTSRKDLVQAFQAEVPSAKLLANEPGKRHVTEAFIGVRLTEAGQMWMDALAAGTDTIASVTDLRGASA